MDVCPHHALDPDSVLEPEAEGQHEAVGDGHGTRLSPRPAVEAVTLQHQVGVGLGRGQAGQHLRPDRADRPTVDADGIDEAVGAEVHEPL